MAFGLDPGLATYQWFREIFWIRWILGFGLSCFRLGPISESGSSAWIPESVSCCKRQSQREKKLWWRWKLLQAVIPLKRLLRICNITKSEAGASTHSSKLALAADHMLLKELLFSMKTIGQFSSQLFRCESRLRRESGSSDASGNFTRIYSVQFDSLYLGGIRYMVLVGNRL